jgi:GntR family transcriptional regulator, transcriptional repressor for pyruvate dehydrogenase complex
LADFTGGTQVRVAKTAEIVAAKIRRAIVLGEILPGKNLPPEAKLIEQFGISRPTIREAIRILEFEELIVVSRGARGGAKVKAPTADFLSRAMGLALQARGVLVKDVYLARVMIEPPAAKLAAETRAKMAASVLRAHVTLEYETLKTEAVIPSLTAHFHLLLMEQSGNQTLALIALALRNLVEKHQTLAHRRRSREPREASQKRSLVGVRSHERLVELIESGDGAAAEAHWRLHMQRAGPLYLDRFAQTSVIDVLEE